MPKKHTLSAEDVLEIYEKIAFVNDTQNRFFNVFVLINWKEEPDDKAYAKQFEQLKRSVIYDIVKKSKNTPATLYAYTHARIHRLGFCTKILFCSPTPEKLISRLKDNRPLNNGILSYTLRTESGTGLQWQWKKFKELVECYDSENVFIEDENGAHIEFNKIFPSKHAIQLDIDNVMGTNIIKKPGFISKFYKLPLQKLDTDLFSAPKENGFDFFELMDGEEL